MRWKAMLAVFVVGAAAFGGIASAHDCTDTNDPETCEETPVVPSWRDGNYVPLFDLQDRDDEEQRKDAQRWREECDSDDPKSPNYQSRQMCYWGYGGYSHTPNEGSDPTDPNSYAPNEWHTGFAASHCFLGEFAHDCEDHHNGEGTHDAHGGAIYADICLTENPESKYCDEGMKDTQVGVTIMDHNPCGTVVPVVACTDEYHVIRPFDTEYTQEQMEDSVAYIQWITENPQRYLCGKPQYSGGNPICPRENPGDAGAGGGAARTADLGLADALAAARAGAIAGTDGRSDAALALNLSGAARTAASGTGTGSTAATAWPLLLVALALVVRARRALGWR